MNDQDNPSTRYLSLRAIFVLHPNVVDLAGQLQTAIQMRSTIEQAMGIIMAENHCSKDEAFAILAGYIAKFGVPETPTPALS